MNRRKHHKNLVAGIIISNQNTAATYAAEKRKKENYDPNKQDNDKMKNQGRQWYFDGKALEEADESKRNNSFFIEGYEAAKAIAIELYTMGFERFISGGIMEDSPYQNNKYFIQGYRDARDQGLIDGIDWRNIPTEWINDDNFNFGDEKLDSSTKRRR